MGEQYWRCPTLLSAHSFSTPAVVPLFARGPDAYSFLETGSVRIHM